jgi:hypothetical protein
MAMPGRDCARVKRDNMLGKRDNMVAVCARQLYAPNRELYPVSAGTMSRIDRSKYYLFG